MFSLFFRQREKAVNLKDITEGMMISITGHSKFAIKVLRYLLQLKYLLKFQIRGKYMGY